MAEAISNSKIQAKVDPIKKAVEERAKSRQSDDAPDPKETRVAIEEKEKGVGKLVQVDA